MKKYAKVINEETKACEVGLGTNNNFYASIGMTEQEVEQAYNGQWYLKGYCPEKPDLTREQVESKRQSEYRSKVDPITAELTRLIQEDIEAERILELKALREQLVDKIKEENPYPTNE